MIRNKKTKYQILLNVIWSLITFILGYGISFFITPYISENLGIEAYGFISLANTIISYIDIIAVAINAFAARYIAMAYHNRDYKSAEEYYSSVFFSNILFISVSWIAFLFIIINAETILDIPSYLIYDVKILLIFVLLNYSVNLIANVFALPAFIKNYASTTSKNASISKIIYALCLGAIIYFSAMKVYSMAMASVVSAIYVFIMNHKFSKKYFPEVCISRKSYSFDKVKKLLSSGIWNSINNIGNMLNSGLDLLITNQLLSSVLMGQISVTKQLANIVASLSFLISSAFQPKQLETYSKKDIPSLVDYFKIAMKCMGVLSGIILAGFITIGKQFYSTWLPSQDIELLYKLTCIVLIGDVLVVVVRPLYYVNTLTDKLKVVCWITVINGILNVVGMYVLIKNFNFGAYAVVLTTMVLNLIQSFLITPFLASSFLNLPNKFVFFKLVIRHLVSTLICTIVFVFLSRFLDMSAGWGHVLVNIAILGAIGVFVMVIGELSKGEIKQIILTFRKK